MKVIVSVLSLLGLSFIVSSGYAGPTKGRSVAQESASSYVIQTASSRSYHRRSKSRRSVSSLPSRIRASGVRVFIFSPRKRAWAAYSANGVRVSYGRASGGAHWCRDVGRSCRTPRGTFRIFSKGGPSCRSSRYPKPRGGAPMPYCMFFTGNYGIHGSPDVPNANVSHGCIRVKPHAARWLSRNFIRIGTKVIVTSY